MHGLVEIEAGPILFEFNDLFVYSNFWLLHDPPISNHNSQQDSENVEHPLISILPVAQSEERKTIKHGFVS